MKLGWLPRCPARRRIHTVVELESGDKDWMKDCKLAKEIVTVPEDPLVEVGYQKTWPCLDLSLRDSLLL